MTCPHSKTKDLYRYDGIILTQCQECFLIFNNSYFQHLSPEDLYHNYYDGETGRRFHFGMELLVRLFRLIRAFKITTIAPEAHRILDVGSGRGFMLYYLKKYWGYERAVGTQISSSAVQFSRRELGLDIIERDLLEVQLDERFDIITIWHVLEHVQNPEKYVEKMCDLLKPGGKLIVEVPNFSSWSRPLTGKYWLGLDPCYHVSFFSPVSLCGLLSRYGFKIRKVHTFSLEYSMFMSAQSLLSVLTRSDQYLFQWLQHPRMELRIIGHLSIFLLLLPVCLLVNLALFFSRKGEVLLVVAEKT